MNFTGLAITATIAIMAAVAIARNATGRVTATHPVPIDVRPLGEQGIQLSDTAPGFGKMIYRFRIETADLKVITLHGDGDSDLDLYVYDEGGALLGVDRNRTDTCLLAVEIDRPQTFSVVIQNMGPTRNTYALAVY